MQIKNLTMSFGTQVIFNDVSLNIPENEKIGVVGLNGAGKTTLFKVIMGLEYPDSGKVYLKNNYRVDWLPQVISDDVDNMEIVVLDYLMLGRPIDKLNARLQSLYDELADPNCNQKEVFNEIEKIQKKLDYWDCWRSRSRFDNPECLSCGGVISCGGGCATGSYNMNGSIYDIDKNNCEYTKKLFRKIHHI